ncbi:hypothetical protein [Deinococcus aestuarii]|uniref:hypothetical protein n=1 Tax=Deinococcus aestuarii TaxID=2774531 RepID=UPI001C0CAF49|nr:hypothetical protein [Deinococcus aestuarii]
MKRNLFPLLTSSLFLASCNSASDAETKTPLVTVAPGASSQVTTFGMTVDSTTTYTRGPATMSGRQVSLPKGLRLAYRFSPSGLQMRADIPGQQFPDQTDRILLIDPAARKVQLLHKNTLKPDLTLAQPQREALANQLGTFANAMLLDPTHPFKRLTSGEFRLLARQANYDLKESAGNRLIYARTFADGQKQTTARLTFDSTAGQVTSSTTEVVTPEVSYTATTDIAYTSVPTLDDTSVPYRMTTRATITSRGDAASSPVEYPKADQVLGPDEELKLRDDQYVVTRFRVPEGANGPTDINTTELETAVEYQDLEVNTLSADYFTGAAK